MEREAAPLSRRRLAITLALLALPVVWVVLRCASSNEIPFISQSSRAPWIAAPEPVTGTLRQWGREDFPVSVFRRRFELDRVPAPAWLRMRALRAFRVLVNGEPVPGAASDGSRWRDTSELDLAPWLRPGANELVVEVENPIGPSLLSLRLEGLEPPLVSDREWRVSVDGGPAGFVELADDTRRSPDALAVGTPRQALRERWVAVALLFSAGAAASLAGRRFGTPALLQRLPAASLALGLAAWAALFARKLVRLPLAIGFDVQSHLQYVELLASRARDPARDGRLVDLPSPAVLRAGRDAGRGGRSRLGEWQADAEGDRVRRRHARSRRHRRARAPLAAGRPCGARARNPVCRRASREPLQRRLLLE